MRERQQRPDDAPVDRRNAAQAAQAAAPEQVQQDRLGVVPGVVRRGDAVAVQSQQKRIAQTPRRQLGGFMRSRGLCGHVSPADRERHVPLGAEHPDEGLVAVGLFPAQTVVKMRGGDGQPQLLPQLQQQTQQRHGIRAAGKGADNAVAGSKQSLPTTPCRDLSPHRAATPDPQRW